MKDNNENNRSRFLLTEFALRNKTSFFVLAILITILGIFSYIQLPKTDFPDIKFPYIYISCIYPGASPEDIESLITKPLERELKGLNDVKEVTSTSYESFAIVFLEFNPEANVDTALQKVREKVDLAKPNLPQDIKEPQINEISIDKIPAMIVNLSGPVDLVNLKTVADKLKDKLDGIPGVLETKIVGGLDKEVKILTDIWALNQYRLSLNDVVSGINRENVNIPGGTVDAGNLKYLVRVPSEFHDFSEIENVILKADGNSIITLKDVAHPVFGYKDDSSISRYNLKNSVSIVVTRKAGENIVQLSENVNKMLKENKRFIPKEVQINVIGDRSEFILSMLNELINTIITGVILVFLVLLIFMGKRNAMFVAIAIPLSMFITLIIIRFLGYSLNMIVLFGLILVSGRLVDDGIVVVENIFRHMQEGEEPDRAADHATAEVAWPVIASTATTLSAFVPLLFWPGMMGQFMKYLPQVFMIAMASSLFVATCISPLFCATFMRLKEKQMRKGDKLSHHPIIIYYEKVLRSFINEEHDLPSLAKRILKNGFVVITLIIGIFLFGKFSPNIDYALHLGFFDSLIKSLDKFGFSIFLFFIGLGSLTLLIAKPKEDNFEFKRFKKLLYLASFILLVISIPFLDAFKGLAPIGLVRLGVGSLIIFAFYRLISDFKFFSIAAVKRSILIHSVIFMFFGIILSFPGLDVILFPRLTPDRITIKVELPDGSRFFKTNEVASQVEGIISQVALKKPSAIKNFVTQVGATSSWTGSQDTSNYAEINIDFYKSEDRKKLASEYHVRKDSISPYNVITFLRKEIKKVPGAKITIEEEEMGPRTGKPVYIELSGDDLGTLKLLAERVKKLIKNEEGVINLDDSLKEGGSEIQINIDRPKAALAGVNTMMLASTLRTAINGTKASTLRRDDEDKEIEINVKLNDLQRNDYNTLKYLPIPTLRGATIPLSDIAEIKTGIGYGAITHVGFKRVINIEGDISKESGRSSFAVISSIKKKIENAKISLPPGYALNFRGQQEEQKKSNKFLFESFLIAIFLIALVLVSEFNSIVLPLIILFTVILSIIGVGIGLFFGPLLFRWQPEIAPFVVIMTGVGIITLAGIVVNNAIILLDYTILLRKKGFTKVEAIVRAGVTRFRPVLLTAVTTILGLLPMSTGVSIDFTHRFLGIIPTLILESDSSQWWAPLADAVICGLAFATVLTLVVVPVLYYYLSDLNFFKKK